MRGLAVFFIVGFVAVSFFSLGLKVLVGLGHLLLMIVLLPIKIVGAVFSIVAALISVPFQILGWLFGALAFAFGLILVPLLPIGLLFAGFWALSRLFRRPALALGSNPWRRSRY